MSHVYTIYGLIDPRNNEIYYIGQTRRDLVERTDEHFFESGDSLVARRNRAIMRLGLVPAIVKLAETQDARTAFHAELYWIHFWTMQGKRLLNREAQPWFHQRYSEQVARRRPEETQTPPVSKRRVKNVVRLPALRKDTYARAKQVAPRQNIRTLEKEWRTWIAEAGKTLPEHPDAAFIAFCKKKSV